MRDVGPIDLSTIVGCLQHLHEERVDGRVSDKLEEEEMLQAFETDGAQGRQSEEQLGEAAGFVRVLVAAVFLKRGVHLLP